jgi:DNA repair protein RecN (Recombination protein N)
MLGLEVVLAAADPVPTFVFDEVDAGVGGRAALGIGRRLARLARTSQVLVVTHLAQVAAFADRHLTVVKSSDGEVTVSGVTALDAQGRVRELARMLGGMADSGTAQAHAQELLETAEQERTVSSGRQTGRQSGGETGPQRGRAGQRGRGRDPRTGERLTATSRRSVGPSSGEDAQAAAPTRP